MAFWPRLSTYDEILFIKTNVRFIMNSPLRMVYPLSDDRTMAFMRKCQSINSKRNLARTCGDTARTGTWKTYINVTRFITESATYYES